MDGAYDLCEQFLDIFDREHFYLEIQDHGIPLQQKSMKVCTSFPGS